MSAGHSTATYEQALSAFDSGVTYGTHLFNAMQSLGHRSPNLPGALLTNPNISVGIIVDGIHLHPAVVRLAWLAKGSQHITLVTDAMAALGMPPGAYQLGEHEVSVDKSTARLADGTLAGSILSSDQALRNLMKFSGCSLAEALPTLTATPAQVLGLEDQGKIEPGYVGNLVILSADGFVQHTIVRGNVLYSHLK